MYRRSQAQIGAFNAKRHIFYIRRL